MDFPLRPDSLEMVTNPDETIKLPEEPTCDIKGAIYDYARVVFYIFQGVRSIFILAGNGDVSPERQTL